jgi:flagellar motility protein MotE (MotC chaperone)
MLLAKVVNVFRSKEGGSYRGSWAGPSIGLLIVLAALALLSASICSGQNSVEGLKKWLHKSPQPTEARYSPDKRAVESMLEALQLRQEELLKKEQEMETARKSLEELQERLKQQMASIKEMKDAVEELLKKAESQKQERIDGLVSLYGTMNSQNAASALLELFAKDPSLVSAIFQALDKKRAATILDAITATSPSVAAEITMRVGKFM